MSVYSIKSFLLLTLFACFAVFFLHPTDARAQKLNGAGATFPYPVYSKWAFRYNQITGLEINYQSIGSGGGIQQIKARTVDFGASDAPLTKDELDKIGIIQFPMVIGGVVPVINLPGIKPGQLKLSPETLAGLFLGKIKTWNDPSIRAVNPGLTLPNRAVVVVHRADGSGTTWIFTNYLDKISPEWHSRVGTDKAVSWPLGVAGKGNEGVAAYVQRIAGSIGYVEYAYAFVNKMNYTLLRNIAGDFVAPTIDSFQAAAANADWKNAPGFYMVLTNQSGKDSWPITGASFILLYKEQKNAAMAKALLGFFDWCFRHGDSIARQLNYVPLPQTLFEMVEEQWAKDIRSGGQRAWK